MENKQLLWLKTYSSARSSLLQGVLLATLTGCSAQLAQNSNDLNRPLPSHWHSALASQTKQEKPLNGIDKSADRQAQLRTHCFNDPILNQLLERAWNSNLDLKQAAARLKAARAYFGQATSGLFPQVTLQKSAAQNSLSKSTLTGLFADLPGYSANLYDAHLDASWEIDLFGRQRALRRSAKASAESAELQRLDCYISVAGEISRLYIEWRGLQLQKALLENSIEASTQVVELTARRLEAGIARPLDSLQAKAQLARVRSKLPSIEWQSAITLHRLAIMMGQTPGSLNLESFAPNFHNEQSMELIEKRSTKLGLIQLADYSQGLGCEENDEKNLDPSHFVKGSSVKSLLSSNLVDTDRSVRDQGEENGPRALPKLLPDPLPQPSLSFDLGVPSDLLKRRPDIRAAERELASAIGSVDAAKLSYFPSFTLTGALGYQSMFAHNLMNQSNSYWSLIPGVNLPLFNGGLLRCQLNLSKAKQESALMSYEAIVLSALEEVENSLTAIECLQLEIDQLKIAVEAENGAFLLALTQYEHGFSDFIVVLQAQNQLLDNERNLLTAEIHYACEIVALYKAIGGGYQPSELDHEPSDSAGLI